LLSLMAWVFSVICILSPLDVRNSDHWDMQVSDGIVYMNYWHARPVEFGHVVDRGYYMDRFYFLPTLGSIKRTYHWGFEKPRFEFMSSLNATGWKLCLPVWMLVLVPIAMLLLGLLVRGRAIPSGHCQECRYNLKGNETGTCPECGTAVTHHKKSEVAN